MAAFLAMSLGTIFYLLTVLVLTQASTESPQNETKAVKLLAVRGSRQLSPYEKQNNNKVVDIEDEKKQYYKTNYDTIAYGFGYDVSPNGQFHHENRGLDGVTYGCYGYIDQVGYLRATHYVADSHGYRVVAPEKSVKVYPDEKYEYDEKSDDQPIEPVSGQIIPWSKLLFPKGCGRTPDGVPTKPLPKPPQKPPRPANPVDITAQISNSSSDVSYPGQGNTIFNT